MEINYYRGDEGAEVAASVLLFANDKILICLVCLDTDAPDIHNVLGLLKGAVFVPVVHNALGIGWPDTLQGYQFIYRGFVDVDLHLFLGHCWAYCHAQQKSDE